MSTTQSRIYQLTVDEQERKDLLQILEQWVSETREDKRHSDSTEYRDMVAVEESRFETLLEKVRRLA